MENQSNSEAEERQDFILNTGSQGTDFQNRSQDVFGGLGALEDLYNQEATRRVTTVTQHEEKDDVLGCPDKADEQCNKQKETEFKMPQAPPPMKSRKTAPKRPKTPDYVLHPYSWKKYSLNETGEENMDLKDDALNRKIALDFLKERRKIDEVSGWDGIEEDTPTRIVFKKPVPKEADDVKKGTDVSASVSSSPFIDHTHRMPEYVIGKEKPTFRKRTHVMTEGSDDSTCTQSTSLALEHLEDSDQSENTGEPHGKRKDQSEPASVLSSKDDSEAQGKPGFKVFKGKARMKIRTRVKEDES